MRHFGWLLAAVVWVAWSAPRATGETMTRASLILEASRARPGDTLLAGVHLRMAPLWHTYWRNPGESGLATTIQWTLPPGIEAGEIQWPVPEAFTSGGLTTYVYHQEVVLLVPLKLAPTLAAASVELKAKVAWLECQEACVPGSAEVKAVLAIGGTAQRSADAPLLEKWRQRIPVPNPALQVTATWGRTVDGETRELEIEGLTQSTFVPTDFYAYSNNACEVTPKAVSGPAPPGKFRLVIRVKRLEKIFPDVLRGLLVQRPAGGLERVGYEVALAPSGADAARDPGKIGALPAGRAAPGGTMAAPPTTSGSLFAMLGLAFLGGLILNVMPCVLPVIALKILGFVQQSKEAPLRVRQLGLIYALGVLASFLVLAVIVVAVRHTGGSASWGMQMQNPYFRLALTVIVTLVALNLFGLFEVSLGGGALSAAAGLASKEGAAGAFFNGVLATALATPCTAPFLTVALGFAFTQSPLVIGLMFSATALGLAAPYVVLSWQPGWLRFLPKPGAWMQRFKVGMGFPMLATAVWLFDLTAPSFGEGGVLWLGLFLVVLAVAAWVWGEFVQRGGRRKGVAAACCGALLALGYGYALEAQLHWRAPVKISASAEVIRDYPDGIEWHPWSPAAVEAARASGRPVLVDFTAKWCLTCKSNKKFALDIPAVRARLRQVNALALRADNTDPNPAIDAELKRYQRAGVPLALVFPPQTERPALVLPALLTPSLVLEALAKAAP